MLSANFVHPHDDLAQLRLKSVLLFGEFLTIPACGISVHPKFVLDKNETSW